MMKHLTIVALFLASASAFGQVRVQPGAVVGFGAFKYSDSSNNPLVKFSDDGKAGLLFGGVIDITFTRYLSLATAMEYLNRGGSYSTDNDFTNTTITTTDNLGYLEMPVNLKLKCPVPLNVTPYALAGLNLGYLLSATQSVNNSQTDIKSELSSIAYGYNLGAGAECDAGQVIPYFELNYTFNNDGNVNSSAGGGGMRYNSGFEFKLGARFKT